MSVTEAKRDVIIYGVSKANFHSVYAQGLSENGEEKLKITLESYLRREGRPDQVEVFSLPLKEGLPKIVKDRTGARNVQPVWTTHPYETQRALDDNTKRGTITTEEGARVRIEHINDLTD